MLTVARGTNADLIANIARLYLPDGALVADVTYGRGVFWRKCQEHPVTIWASDLKPILLTKAQQDWLLPLRIMPLCADFRCLPYGNAVFDIVVLDPPYIHNPGNHMTDGRYNNAATSKGMCHRDILLKLYYPGMQEAARILKPGGQLWVKCKDQIESSEQRWAHREMYDLIRGLGSFQAKDYAILHTAPPNGKRWQRQFHLRKNHSVLWIFERTSAAAQMKRPLSKHGGDRKSRTAQGNHDQAYNMVSLIPHHGNSRPYLLARLERDHPDIFLKFHAGEFRSVRAAARAAGIGSNTKVSPDRDTAGDSSCSTCALQHD